MQSSKRVLAGMAERRVAQVVRQGNGLDQVLVEPQRTRNGAAQLRHLQRVRHARAKQVTLVVQEDLRLVDQPPERRGMNDAVAIALVIRRGSARPVPDGAVRAIRAGSQA